MLTLLSLISADLQLKSVFSNIILKLTCSVGTSMRTTCSRVHFQHSMEAHVISVYAGVVRVKILKLNCTSLDVALNYRNRKKGDGMRGNYTYSH